MGEGGERSAHLRILPVAPAFPLDIDLSNWDQVTLDLHRDIGEGARIWTGSEFNAVGPCAAYWLMCDCKGDPPTSLRLDLLRIPTTDCLHLFKPLAEGQVRGITSLAPVLMQLHELDYSRMQR